MTSSANGLDLLKAMVRLRMIEQAIADHYSEQQMRCPVHLSIGQEAPSAAFSLAAQRADYAVSTHRGHAHYLAKGGGLGPMIAEIYGKATGCSRGRGGSMHLADIAAGFMGTSAIVGNSIPVGVGLGLAIQTQGRPQASAIFLGDGATEEGVFYESVGFAALRGLPVVFLCENNLYSVYSPLGVRQPAGRDLSAMVQALGIDSTQVDGNDALECFLAVDEALSAARAGRGPRFVEFMTFRHLEHCGPDEDDHLGYRLPGELDEWRGRDPIELLCQHAGLEVPADFVAEVESEIAQAFDAAESAPYADLEEAANDVYA